MSFTRTLSIDDVCVYGTRVTTSEKVKRTHKDGSVETVAQAKRYRIENRTAIEELVFYAGRKKKVILKSPIEVENIFNSIKHVYDKNGVLIARRQNDKLRCTSKGMGKLIV
ncbi:conjugal transfer protein TraE [Enterococcus faecium]|nr:conjugal transfer protein TraE [Enterococcus faecium]